MQSKRGKITANISEIFCSIQGEGKYIGWPTIFIRFTSCNLNCGYCDTKRALTPNEYCCYEQIPFSGKITKIKNDLTVEQVVQLLANLKTSASCLAFTGGEPLLQAEFIKELIISCGRRYQYLLETNGTLSDNLPLLKNKIDIFSVDLKKGYEKEFIIFWQKIRDKDKYVKIVLEKDLKLINIAALCQKLKIKEVFLQPDASISGSSIKKKKSFDINKINTIFNKKEISIRFLPQLHKLLEIQ